jgi:hypothetical protein
MPYSYLACKELFPAALLVFPAAAGTGLFTSDFFRIAVMNIRANFKITPIFQPPISPFRKPVFHFIFLLLNKKTSADRSKANEGFCYFNVADLTLQTAPLMLSYSVL